MDSDNKNWAEAYINNPLTAPDPSDETGPGSSLRLEPETPVSTTTPTTPPISNGPRRLSKTNPFRRSIDHGVAKEASATTTEKSYPSPPPSGSPRLHGHSPRNSIGHRQEPLTITGSTRPRRSSSLRERYPGDPTVHPLEQLAREKAIADRARQTTKKHAIRPDTIDNLDASGTGRYHHGGPYDATLYARNNSYKISPVAAVAGQNQEALKATPHEKIVDSLKGHRPLDGVASYPPGTVDRNGQTYDYREGENMMIEENAGGGPYKRWAGIQYHPDDIKGKGEPSYSIEKALKEHNLNENNGISSEGVEMQSRSRSGSGAISHSRHGSEDHRKAFLGEDELDGGVRRSGSFGNRLRQRVGSLRKKSRSDE